MNLQDFNRGIDFTAYITQTAAMHNTMVDAAFPYTDKGLVMVSTDTALNTPAVPDASVTTKWKTYLWMRIPHVSDTSKIPFIYTWNDNATSIATYLKWQRVTAVSSEAANVAALDVRVTALEAADVTILGIASAANNAAALASTAATNAEITAASASTNATAALANAATAQTTATIAESTANSAQTNATAALAASTTATTAANNAFTLASNAAIQQSVDFIFNYAVNTYSFSHGFTAAPKDIRWTIICTSNDPATSHVVGTELDVDTLFTLIAGGIPRPIAAHYATLSTVNILIDGGAVWVTKIGGGLVNLTSPNWKLRCYYSKG